jgi:hypothetical protein
MKWAIFRGPRIDVSYQVSVHLAKGFQRRRLKCFFSLSKFSIIRNYYVLWCGGHIELNIGRTWNLETIFKSIPWKVLVLLIAMAMFGPGHYRIHLWMVLIEDSPLCCNLMWPSIVIISEDTKEEIKSCIIGIWNRSDSVVFFAFHFFLSPNFQ